MTQKNLIIVAVVAIAIIIVLVATGTFSLNKKSVEDPERSEGVAVPTDLVPRERGSFTGTDVYNFTPAPSPQ